MFTNDNGSSGISHVEVEDEASISNIKVVIPEFEDALARAESDSSTVAFSVDIVSNAAGRSVWNRKRLVWLMMILVVVVGIVCVSSIGAIRSRSSKKATSVVQTSTDEEFGTQSASTSAPSLSPIAKDKSNNKPTDAPTKNRTTSPTAAPKTLPPSVVNYFDRDIIDDPSSPEARAYEMMNQQKDMKKIMENDLDDKYTRKMTVRGKLLQRFTMLTLWMSLTNFAEVPPDVDECEWPIVTCNEKHYVKEIHMARRDWNGVIPRAIGHLQFLQVLDLSENAIKGGIPDELYDLTDLRMLYLHENKLTGTLSESIANLYELREVYLGKNQFTGSLPTGLGSNSTDHIRRLRYLSLSHNRFSGTLPSSLLLHRMYYFDLSYNDFSGPLDADSFDGWYRMRHIYLDHNQFTGSVPESLVTAGEGNMRSIYLNNNKFTGEFPTPKEWAKDNSKLTTIKLQNNGLTGELSTRLCELFVFENGDMIELDADCNICSCKGLCNNCK